MLEKTKKWAKSQKFMDIGPQMAKSMVDNQKGVNFQHWTIWGPPLKNKKIENRASTRFKLAQIRPRAKIS